MPNTDGGVKPGGGRSGRAWRVSDLLPSPYEAVPSERSKEIINQHRAVKAALMKTKGTKPV